ITDLFVQVRGRGDAYYKSAFVPLAEGLDGSFDPLEFVLLKSDGRFKIHVWINVMYIWSADNNPASKEHLLFKHPEWSAVSKSGTPMIDEGLKKLKERNKEGYYLSPGNNEFQEYFLKVVEELVHRYKIDGVHMDYIRYAGKEYDYSVTMRSKFILNYNIDPLTADSNGSVGVQQAEQKKWFEKLWSTFRRGELTTFISRIRHTVNSIRANIILSAAVWADMDMATNEMFQDWPAWIKNGYIDLAVPMNYAPDNGLFEIRVKNAKDKVGDKMMAQNIVMGISMYNQNSEAMKEKVAICRAYGLKGISFFSYESVRKDRTYFKKMAEVGH
ncbi:family 10 glycosylhydrolase, partial [bacterium]|nr:family 10 glycosylhydrolase [bacterium]